MQIAFLLVLLALAGCTAYADSHTYADRTLMASADRCDDTGEPDRGRSRICESRTLRLDRRDLALDAHMNGSVRVIAWDRDDVKLVATVEAEAGSAAEAQRLVSQTRVLTDRTIRADAPEPGRSGRQSDWVSVHFDVYMPRAAALSAEAFNGAITVEGVTGRVRAKTLNGALRIWDTGGELDVETVNGAIDLRVADGAARGRGVRARTTNGSVAVALPAAFSADLSARTVMGSIRLDDALTLRDLDCARSDCARGQVRAVLGRGGAPLDVSTTNGSVRLRAR